MRIKFKKWFRVLLLTLIIVSTGSICSPIIQAATVANSKNHIKTVTAITEVFGDGQKVTAVAVEYDKAIDNATLSKSDFTVTDRTITKVYANTVAEKAAEGKNGKYVIIELSSDDKNAATLVTKVLGGGSVDVTRPDIKVYVKQVGSLATTGKTVYKSNSVVKVSTKEINVLVDDFQQLVYNDSTYNISLMYNLYVPKDYDPNKSYPLVLFMPDASATSSIPTMTLMQGLGAVIWASPSEQAKHECIVLAPQYSSRTDNNIDVTVDLVNSIVNQYSIDKNRLYTTGQSGGCMNSIAIDIKYPDLFAASFLVAGQWDASLVAPMVNDKLWIVVSEGDIQAFPGMNSITTALEKAGATVSRATWNGKASATEFTTDVVDMILHDNAINYTVLQKGTVVDAGDLDNPPNNHMDTWKIAYNIEGIRDWLFTQVKTDVYSAQALYNTGFNAFRAGNYVSADVYFAEAANKGNTSAAEMLGDAYQSGKGVAIDYAKAAKWNQTAIDLGSARGYTNLGLLYMNGLGVTQDYTKALELFEKATYAGDFKGPRYAGIIYFNGYGDVDVNYAKAAQYFKIAAGSGDTTANYYLGMMYEQGLEFKQDYAKAIEYYEKAAPSVGHAEMVAMVALGHLYENGLGVAKDMEKATEWYQKAADLGDANGKAALARLAAN